MSNFTPGYSTQVARIIEPDKYVPMSQYLVRRWLPDLGADGVAILLFLRSKCFYNRKSGELRNHVQLTLAEIGDAIGVSATSVRRQIQTNTALKQFVSIREEYRVEERNRGVIKAGHTYVVLMDDPLHPSDRGLLARLSAEEVDAVSDPKQRARLKATSTSSQSGRTLGSQSLRPSKMEGCPTNLEGMPSNLEGPLKELDYLDDLRQQQQGHGDSRELDVVVSPCVDELVSAGITRAVALELVGKHSEEEIRQQLAWLPYRGARDSAAMLVKALTHGWTAPASVLAAEKTAANRATAAADRVRRQREIELLRTEAAAEEARAEELWSLMTPEEQARVDALVMTELEGLRGIPRGGMVWQNLIGSKRREILRQRLDDPFSEG